MAVSRYIREHRLSAFRVIALNNGADTYEADAYANWALQTRQQPTNDSYRFFHENVEW